MRLVIDRKEFGAAVIGVTMLDGKVFGFSLENHEYLIPIGFYTLKKYSSPKFGRTLWLVQDLLPDHIELHAGNTADDCKGCILLGMRVGTLDDKRAVLDSIKAINAFMSETAKIDNLEMVVL